MATLQSPPPSAEALPSPRHPSRPGARKAFSKAAATIRRSVRKQETITEIEDLRPRFCENQAAIVRTNLLAWYDAHQRKLPWRYECTNEVPDSELQQRRAYATWVSEVMLQQTRVTTVLEYFNRWMKKWPTVRDLAAATQEEVYKMWAGLGYYRRARFLLEGAKHLVESYEGELPSSAEKLQEIRGIGKYTAGAIASIAFGQPVPIVDGNVIRVLCRLKAVPDDPTLSNTRKYLWSLAEQLVDIRRPGDLNQALMELGATSCSVTSPQCGSCPLQTNCDGYMMSKGRKKSTNRVHVTDFPAKIVKPTPRQKYVAVCVLENSLVNDNGNINSEINGTSSHLLLVKRQNTGLLAGLWEFPSTSLEGHTVSSKECESAIDKYFKDTLGLELCEDSYSVKERKAVGTYKHIFSHIHMHMTIEWMHICGYEQAAGNLATHIKELNGTEVRWVPINAMCDIGLTSGVKKVYQMFLDFRQGKKVNKVRGKRKRKEEL